MPRRACHFERNRQRGLVLPTVLWITILAITIGVSYASSVHLSTRSADNIKTALLLKYDAVSGVYLALDQLLARPVAETTRYRLRFNGSDLDIVVTPEHTKTSVNSASADEIRGAIADAGIDAGTARMLAARIIDWRDRDHDLQPQGMEDAQYHAAGRGYGAKDSRIDDLSELLLIADIERDAFTGLSRRLTIYSGGARRIYSITVTSSRGGNDQIFGTRAIVQLTGTHKPYRILKWHHNHG
jgi:general secretion pathway protein K